MNPDKPKAKRIARWINLVTWSAIGFFAIGYLPACIFGPAPESAKWAIIISMAGTVMAVIPYAVRIGRPVKSALIAALLGAVAGIGIVNAFLTRGMIPPQGLWYVAATAFFCAGVGALFGYMALQRYRQVEQEWEDRG
jgi:hypothetical protein